jgi:hypothetical protein
MMVLEEKTGGLDMGEKRYKLWGLQSDKALMCVQHSSVIVGEGSAVRNCRGIVKIGVMCKLNIMDYSVCA